MSKEEDKFVFDIEEPTEKFTKHLGVSFNDRIILSAPFGAGKTYFLKEYFKKNSDEYEVIHLFPVNYSVTSNEDIFELIKYDILFELFGKDVEFDKSEFTKLDYLPLFFKENVFKIADVFTPLISIIPKIGKSIYDIKENLKELFQEFQKKYDQIKIDDKQSVVNYLEEDFNQKKGNVYEDDFYSQLIRQLVNQLKQFSDQNKQEKETVLIIDDLDRIDPEHIFRILNVLSAHMDIENSENKFGFDKIVLVFDQYNVRNIFKNRYGTDVDFTGYIDKFYSYKIFEFSNILGLEKDIKGILKSISSINKNIDFEKDDIFANGVIYTFRRLIQANVLTIRRLLKVGNQKMIFEQNFRSFDNIDIRFKGQFYVLALAELLLFIYEDWDELLSATKKLDQLDFNEDLNNRGYILSIIEESLLLLDSGNHNFETQDEDYKYSHNKFELEINYLLVYSNTDRKYYCRANFKDRGELDNPKILSILHLTFEKIRDKRILK